MASFRQHLEDDCGIDIEAELATSCERVVEYRGRNIEVYYSENACRWGAFVMGLGEETSSRESVAIERAKSWIDRTTKG